MKFEFGSLEGIISFLKRMPPALEEALVAEYSDYFAKFYPGQPPFVWPGTFKDDLRLAGGQMKIMLVYELPATFVGAVSVASAFVPKTKQLIPDVLYLARLIVARTFRGRHISRTIMENLMSVVAEHDFYGRKITTYIAGVDKDNAASLASFKSFGYEEIPGQRAGAKYVHLAYRADVRRGGKKSSN